MDIIKTPIAKELTETRPIIASPFILLFSLNLSSKKATIINIGRDTSIGFISRATAIAIAPKATWESPSPIIEYLFKTKLTPKREAQTETKKPTIKALTKNG